MPEGGPEACVITAHDAKTGEELWRTRMIPAPGEPGDETWGDVPYEERRHVGAWMVPSFDPTLNLIYVGTSVTSPAPKFMLGGVEHKYLYHNSTLALDADTGAIVWYYQHLNDHWDLDHPFERILVNVGDPPALPGRPSVFDVSGSNVRNSPREPLKHHAGESSMNNYRSLNHTKWECQYHVVFIPKYRRKTLYGGLRHYLGDVLRRLAEQRESRVEEGHLLADHVHMLVSIPPQYSVAQVIGYIKGKSAIHIAREFAGRPRNFVGQHFWARGYYVSTVGQDERVVREYIQQQEREDRRLEQLRLEE